MLLSDSKLFTIRGKTSGEAFPPVSGAGDAAALPAGGSDAAAAAPSAGHRLKALSPGSETPVHERSGEPRTRNEQRLSRASTCSSHLEEAARTGESQSAGDARLTPSGERVEQQSVLSVLFLDRSFKTMKLEKLSLVKAR